MREREGRTLLLAPHFKPTQGRTLDLQREGEGEEGGWVERRGCRERERRERGGRKGVERGEGEGGEVMKTKLSWL